MFRIMIESNLSIITYSLLAYHSSSSVTEKSREESESPKVSNLISSVFATLEQSFSSINPCLAILRRLIGLAFFVSILILDDVTGKSNISFAFLKLPIMLE